MELGSMEFYNNLHSYADSLPEHNMRFGLLFDHTIDPEKTITTWRNQLNPQGKIFLEYSERSSRGHRQDPLDATNKEISSLIGDNGMIVEEVWRDGIQHGGVIFICGMAK